jgi:hypothetical protein
MFIIKYKICCNMTEVLDVKYWLKTLIDCIFRCVIIIIAAIWLISLWKGDVYTGILIMFIIFVMEFIRTRLQYIVGYIKNKEENVEI